MKATPTSYIEPMMTIDDDNIYTFCNSLNAIYHPLSVSGMTTAARHVIRAQGVITRLYEENKELKRKLNQLKESEGKPDGKV